MASGLATAMVSGLGDGAALRRRRQKSNGFAHPTAAFRLAEIAVSTTFLPCGKI